MPRILAILAVLALFATTAGAQTLSGIGEQFEQDRKRLENYSWKSRTQVLVDGEEKLVELFLVRHDDDGKEQKTLLSQPAKKKTKKKGDALYADLRALIDSYVNLDPKTMRRVVATAMSVQGRGSDNSLTHIQARNVNRGNDLVDLWVETVTRRLRRFEIFTSMEGEPVKFQTEFADLPHGGPTRMVNTVVRTEIKNKKLVMTIENFEYKRQDQ